MLVVLTSLLFLVAATEGFLLWRAVTRLLQYDQVFGAIAPVLESYSVDLKRMVSADVNSSLFEHPEVLDFHKRNLRALEEISSITESVSDIRPRPTLADLPRPDVE